MNLETIETPRLILRRLSPDDLRYMFGHYEKEHIMEMLGHRSEEDFQKEKHKFEKGYTTYNRSFEQFQLIDKTSGTVLGACGFHTWSADHSRAELGYALIDDTSKRQGFMTEALGPIIDHGFYKMKLHRIEALVGPDNTPSLKLLATFGFKQEGVLREHYFVNNRFEDSILFSKLAGER
jgi:ribosomal-protein-alanine N-acetyltransferase